MNGKRILTVAVVLGILGGLVPLIFGPEYLTSTLPISMMIGTYWIVPRVHQKRYLSTVIASVLSGLISMVIYFGYDFTQEPAADVLAAMQVMAWTFLMYVVIISVLGSLFFLKTHDWAEKKRVAMEAKIQAKATTDRRSLNATKPKKKYKKKKKK
ncbi:MAG TPA: hypothetical protein VFV52_08055 [Bacilli bacterium]|nr:hypothetical protein [Bacilli bacterium]